ncbi:hypothetical protein NEF87_000162 [Candidatus Lokiarchaeum ossiferum]|uniref:Uncharacterized protein n=1 Tax=Candidatus Lokiarchaeum ossiferum TaxID=2951803 RepID=A0ABY6HK24_9ARCH|nr:hypothetical protein NEF87_000162 [Candidatus Lokiarchaeum sp. B-35]
MNYIIETDSRRTRAPFFYPLFLRKEDNFLLLNRAITPNLTLKISDMANINIEFARYIPINGVLYQLYSILIDLHFIDHYLENELDNLFLMYETLPFQYPDHKKSVNILVS